MTYDDLFIVLIASFGIDTAIVEWNRNEPSR